MLAAAATLGLAAVPAHADEAAIAVVNAFYVKLLDVMKRGPALGFQGRFDALKPAFETAFNVPFMTQFVTGSAWSGFSDDQKAKLMAAFTGFSVAFYAHNFQAYDGETFSVDGSREISQGTLVSTRIIPKGDAPVPMNYLLRKGDLGWQVIDVFLDGTISQLATRRTDFAKPLQENGVSALIEMLESKTRELTAQG
jgi:phospholipid transport system substrate-binding protein